MKRAIRKVLILHVTAGAGHTKAAEAIEKAIRKLYPDVSVKCVDSLDYTNPIYKTFYANTYLMMVRRTPALWGYFYDRYDEERRPLEEKLRSLIENFQASDMRRLLEAYEPDSILCTHFLPLDIVTRWQQREKVNIPTHAVVTDFDAHSFWVYGDIDSYFVATEEVQRTLFLRGIPQDHIHITGIPIDPCFSDLGPPDAYRSQLGFRTNSQLVLILSGGFGVGDIVDLVESFAGAGLPYQIAVVSGKNKTLQASLEKVAPRLPIPVKVLGFVTNMHEYMAASDLVISKPGGLTTSEVLATGRPMVIIDPIPGQEQRNSDYLLEQGVATTLHHLEDAPYHVEKLLRDPDRMARMAQRAKAIGRPRAAFEIAQRVIEGGSRGKRVGSRESRTESARGTPISEGRERRWFHDGDTPADDPEPGSG